jgi:hypothetical protein
VDANGTEKEGTEITGFRKMGEHKRESTWEKAKEDEKEVLRMKDVVDGNEGKMDPRLKKIE